jgi:hypothetical protein
MTKVIYLTFVLIVIILAFTLPRQSFGHGAGYETLPPKMLDDKKITMEITFSIDNSTKRKHITFSMFDIDNGITVSNSTYHIKTIKDNKILFNKDFHTKDGYLRFELVPTDDKHIRIEEKQRGSISSINVIFSQSLSVKLVRKI